MAKRTRRNHSSEQKASLLKKHLVEQVPVSDIGDQNQLQPSLFYYWQRQLFENATKAFDTGRAGAFIGLPECGVREPPQVR